MLTRLDCWSEVSDSRQSILELFYARLGVMRRGAAYSTTCCIFHDAHGKHVLKSVRKLSMLRKTNSWELVERWCETSVVLESSSDASRLAVLESSQHHTKC